MACFRLDILNDDTAKEWLLCRTENYIIPSIIETAYPLKAEVEIDSCISNLEVLVKPLGVVNGLLLGYVLGDPYYFALCNSWGPMVHPACRRFVLNLDTEEFVEFHWYLHSNTVLVNWMKSSIAFDFRQELTVFQFPTSKHRLRYFVLYEIPEMGKLPYKLLYSIEIITQRASDVDDVAPKSCNYLPSYATEQLQNVPVVMRFINGLLDTFSGTCRWTRYEPTSLACLSDLLYSYSARISINANAEELRRRELQRLCYRFVPLSANMANNCLYISEKVDLVLKGHSLSCSLDVSKQLSYIQEGMSHEENCVLCRVRQGKIRRSEKEPPLLGWTNSWSFLPQGFCFDNSSENESMKINEQDSYKPVDYAKFDEIWMNTHGSERNNSFDAQTFRVSSLSDSKDSSLFHEDFVETISSEILATEPYIYSDLEELYEEQVEQSLLNDRETDETAYLLPVSNFDDLNDSLLSNNILKNQIPLSILSMENNDDDTNLLSDYPFNIEQSYLEEFF
eukprot:jgi/Galph1/1056/GphlegSOOS_G5903.1